MNINGFELKNFGIKYTFYWFFFILCLCLSTNSGLAQVANTQNNQDLTKRSDLTVDPVSFGLNLRIPLGNYPGRNGVNMPVVINYSSKVWRMNYIDPREYPAPDQYNGHLLEPLYAEHSVAGWTTSLDTPRISFDPPSKGYSQGGIAGNCQSPLLPQPCYFISKMYVHMPDGSTHELRKDDIPRQTIDQTGVYYAVDGSNVKFNFADNTLTLPDGSRYIFSVPTSYPYIRKAIKYIDKNGNAMVYNLTNRTWTDTLGRILASPFSADPQHTGSQSSGVPDEVAAGDYTYDLKGINGENLTYTFRWRKLENVRTNPSQPLRYRGSNKFAYGNGFLPEPNLFDKIGNNYVCSSEDLFNPSVLHELILPDGSSYKFTYNVYGEIDKVRYPTGGYETFQHNKISTNTNVYKQTERGVSERRISPSGAGNDEQVWQYAKPTPVNTSDPVYTVVTAPDNTKNKHYLFKNNATVYFDIPDARNDGIIETQTVASDGVTILRRSLSQWAAQGPSPGGTSSATRNPHLVKEVELLFEPSANQALAKTTAVQYDQFLNIISTTEYDFVVLDKTTAQTMTIDQVPSGNPVKTTEIDYVTDTAYLDQNLIGLPKATRIKDAAGNIITKSEVNYDELAYPILTYSSTTIGWEDPGGAVKRGLPTGVKSWDNSANNGAGNWVVSHMQYDQFGNLRKTWSPIYEGEAVGNVSETRYEDAYNDQVNRDTYAFPTKTISVVPDPSGQNGSNQSFEATTVYNFYTGLPISSTDINNQTTLLQYNDPLLRPTKVIAPNGQQTITQYGVPGTDGQLPPNQRFVKVKTQIDDLRWTEGSSWLDGLGRTVIKQSVDSAGDVFIETEYDQMGRVKKVSNPYRAGETIYKNESVFDDLSRIVKVKTPDSAEINTSYSLATSGNQIGIVAVVTDQANKVRRSITNVLGQLIRMDEPDAGGNLGTIAAPVQPTVYSYDVLENLVLVQQNGTNTAQCGGSTSTCQQSRAFVYDSLSRLKQASNPESGTVNYQYDSNGNLTRKTDARGVQITFTYDGLNRARTRSYSAPQGGLNYQATLPVNYSYDDVNVSNSKGKLTKITTGTSQDVFSETKFTSFDNRGRVTGSQQMTDGVTYNPQSYVYNLAGALIEETYPSTRVIKNSLDNDGDLVKVQSKKSANTAFRMYAQNFAYTSSGAVSSMQLGNLLWESAAFNARLQPEQIGLGKSKSASDVLKLNYTYNTSGQHDNSGNVLSQTITVPTAGGHPGFVATQTYTYDSLNRLHDATETISGSQTWKQTFVYDRFGNRTFDELNTTESAAFQKNCFNANNQKVVCSNEAAKYNPAANSADNRLNGYQFDAAGNTTKDADNRKFTYDGENKQTKVELVDANNNVIRKIGEYWYDGEGKRIKKIGYDEYGQIKETTIFVYNASGKLVAEYSNQVAAQPEAKVNYLTNDPLGSSRISTDQNGQVISRQDFQPFGEKIQRAGYGEDSVRKKFTGYERDTELNLDFAQARYYSMNLGRFTTTDPLSFQFSMAIDPQKFNLYVYARNNPYKWVDPDGERLFLMGNVAWLRINVLYEMAGGQATFEQYFDIIGGEVVAKPGVDAAKANDGVKLLLQLVNSSQNFVYFAGTEGEDAAALFKGSLKENGELTQLGKKRRDYFEGESGSGGTLIGTTGRSGSAQPADLANGDAVFAVVAFNTDAVQTQDGLANNPNLNGEISGGFPEADSQWAGLGSKVRPVSFFIHESAENLVFATMTATERSSVSGYSYAHNRAIHREAGIRKALKITGGFAGGAIKTVVPKKKK